MYEFCMDIHNNCFAIPFLETFVNSTKMTMTYQCKIFELEKIPIPFTKPYRILRRDLDAITTLGLMTFNLTPSSAPFSGTCWNRSWWPRRTNPASSQIVTLSTLTLLSLMNQYSWPLMTRMLILFCYLLFVFYIVLVLSSSHFHIYRHLWCIRASIMAKYFQKMTNRKKHWYEFLLVFLCLI